MYLPQSYLVTLLFLIGSMLCWGSWANTFKLCPKYRFQLFYWDYVVGLFVGVALWGFSAGTLGSNGPHFLADLLDAHASSILFALIAGVLFNLANILLVAAIEVAGMAVAFPVGIGLALVIGAAGNYILAPQGNPLLLFGGVALVAIAILCDALAYKARESERKSSRRGLLLSLVSGVLMGSFYPFVTTSISGPHALGPYAVAFFFVAGVAICTLPVNLFLMKRPIDGGSSVAMSDYTKVPMRWHLAGMLGGTIWISGAIFNFVASRVHFVGPAVSYSVGQGATMVSAVWGVFIWHEFRPASRGVRWLIFWMFVCFLAGLGAVAVAPLYAN